MNRFVYGVAVSALILGAGGVAVACEQFDKSAALQNPAAAQASAAVARGFVLAQSQDADKEKAEEEGKEKKPDAMPTRERGPVLAQSQDDDKDKQTTGEDGKPEGDK